MPAITRSHGKQTKLDGTGAGSIDAMHRDHNKAPPKTGKRSNKRPADTDGGGEPTSKSAKKSKSASAGGPLDEDDNAITINRAPVLELWAASVAHILYPRASWETCLSAGGAIATITAISKGRSIGTIAKPEPGEAERKRRQRNDEGDEGLEELEVMSFNLRLDGSGHALVGDKPKRPNEGALRHKYGDDAYERAKTTFADALEAWKDRPDQLNDRAFRMYEDFRPTVPPGQKGWGRKGQLDLLTVKSVVGEGA